MTETTMTKAFGDATYREQVESLTLDESPGEDWDLSTVSACDFITALAHEVKALRDIICRLADTTAVGLHAVQHGHDEAIERIGQELFAILDSEAPGADEHEARA